MASDGRKVFIELVSDRHSADDVAADFGKEEGGGDAARWDVDAQALTFHVGEVGLPRLTRLLKHELEVVGGELNLRQRHLRLIVEGR